MAHDYSEKSRQQIDQETRRATRTDFIIVFVSGLVGLAGALAPSLIGNAGEIVERSLYSTIVAGSVGALLAVAHRLHVFHAESLRLMSIIVRLRNDLAATASWAQKRNLLENMRDRTIAEACCELLEDYENVFDVSQSSLTLKDRKWSLHFNGLFWRSMIAHGKAKGIIVLVTHTSGVENWEGPEAQDSLAEQRDFTSQGNQIIRMFVDREAPRSNPIPEAYRKVMQDMKEHYGIDTVYVGARNLGRIPDATWVLGMNIFMTWSGSSGEHFQIGTNPSELKIFKRRWRNHYKRAQTLEGDPPPISEEIGARLD